MRKQINSLSRILILVGIAVWPLHSNEKKGAEPGELKLQLIKFQAEKPHSVRIKLDWGNGIPMGNNTTANRAQGEGKDTLGRFTYVATRIANPEWTEYSLWISYDSGRKKNGSLRLRWVTNGHEPPGVSEVSDGIWTFEKRMGRLSGTVD